MLNNLYLRACKYSTQSNQSDGIHTDVIGNNKTYRFYKDDVSGVDIFHNEMGFFLKDMISRNLKIFYVKNTFNHSVQLSTSDFNFMLENGVDLTKPSSFIEFFPPNIEFLRSAQSEDLGKLHNTIKPDMSDTLFESFFVFSRLEAGYYFYDLLVVVKPYFDVNFFFDQKFQLIKVEEVTPILDADITYSYIKNLFDFEKLKNTGLRKLGNKIEQDYLDYLKNIHIKEKPSVFTYGNITNGDPLKNPEVWEIYKLRGATGYERLDDEFMLKEFFKHFGLLCYILNHNFYDEVDIPLEKSYSYPVDDIYLLEPGSEKYPYTAGRLLNILESGVYEETPYNLLHSTIISVPKLKCGTPYKNRLGKIFKIYKYKK